MASFGSIESGDFHFFQGTEAAASVGYMFSSCFLFNPTKLVGRHSRVVGKVQEIQENWY